MEPLLVLSGMKTTESLQKRRRIHMSLLLRFGLVECTLVSETPSNLVLQSNTTLIGPGFLGCNMLFSHKIFFLSMKEKSGLSSLSPRQEKHFSTYSLLLGRHCLCGLKGRGTTQMLLLSLTSSYSIISKKSLSLIDIAT